MKPRYFVWLGLALLAVLLLASGVFYWMHHRNATVQVQTAAVTKGPIARRTIVAGTLQTVTKVDVGSQVSGMVQLLDVDFNSIVHKGQVVARLDPAAFKDALDNAQAMLGTAQGDQLGAEVALEDAQQKLTRAQELAAKELIPQSDLDAAKIVAEQAAADVAAAKAQVTRAQGSVEQAQTSLDHTIIKSPADGIVVNRLVDVGQTLAAGFQAPVLFTIAANLEDMQVQADVDQADVGSVKEGQPATFQVEAYPNETFHGTISQVRLQPSTPPPSATNASPTGSNASPTGGPAGSATAGVTYTTIIDVANPDRKLRPGMTATVFLSGSERSDAIRIPNQALLFRPSIDLLKAVGQSAPSNLRAPSGGDEEFEQVWSWDGKRFTPIAVTLGLSDAQFAEQASGPLEPDDQLVINTSFKNK